MVAGGAALAGGVGGLAYGHHTTETRDVTYIPQEHVTEVRRVERPGEQVAVSQVGRVEGYDQEVIQ